MGVKNYVGELQLNGKQVATVDQIPSLSYSEGLRYRRILAWDIWSMYVSGSGTCTDTKIIIPSLLKDGNKIVGIYEKAFDNNTNITSVVISEGIVSIGEYAFSGCTNLTSITIPNSVTWIAKGAFYNCPKLNNIILPNKITSIGNSAFEKCTSLTSIVIPDGVRSIGNYAFDSCTNLKHVTFSNNLTSIGNYAFDDCVSLANIELPNSLQSIGDYAFSENALINVTIPDSVTDIGNHAFQYCRSLESVMIPKSVVNMGENVFIMGNNTTLYCEAESQPDTWNTAWKDTNYPVVWGSVMDFEGVNDVFNATKEIEGIKTKSISATSATFGENDDIVIDSGGITIGDDTVITDCDISTPDLYVSSCCYIGENDDIVIAPQGIGMVEGATLAITDKVNISTDGVALSGGATLTIGGVDVIGNIEQALDAILAIQKELMPKPITIVFTILDTEYTATEGMTWTEWIDSEYNIDGFYIDSELFDGGIVMDAQGSPIFVHVDGYPTEHCKPSDIITPNGIYGWE